MTKAGKARCKRASDKWRAKNPRYHADYARFSRYGLTPDETALIKETQGQQCAICPMSIEKTFHIDHDHASNRLRGFLCPACNKMLGYAKDLPATLRSAALYLERHQ